jgi:glycosyltransferase involved in cell wall biosynthesis
LLQALAAGDPRVRIVRHPTNQGYGAALRTGFAAARFEWVFLTDGDGQLDPAQLPDAVAALGDADGVVGYRLRRADSLSRRVNTALWNGMVRAVLGVPVRDLNCAFKLLPRTVLAPETLTTSGAVISAEILARAARAGHRFVEIPVAHRPRRRGRSSGGRPAVVLRAAWELPRLCWRLRREGSA